MEGIPLGHLLSRVNRCSAQELCPGRHGDRERGFRSPQLCRLTLGLQVLLGPGAHALTCRSVTSPLIYGDILMSYFPFPISTCMRPLAMSGSATADGEESPEPPRPPLR